MQGDWSHELEEALNERGFNRFKHLLISIWTGFNCAWIQRKSVRDIML